MHRINETRFIQDIEALAQIGATAAGGVTRLAFSPADIAGRHWFHQRILDAGLEYARDGAANQSARLPTAEPDAPTLLIGSHLDTVENGGRYDGALGVIAALETLRVLKEDGRARPYHLEAIAFTDEEGTMLGEFGSQALAGTLTAEDLAQPRGGVNALRDGMRRLGITADSARHAARDADKLAGFIELHIEQGPRLEEHGVQIGTVTSIVGIRSMWLTFNGRAAHAGTTPLQRRQDALLGAADFIQQARRLVQDRFTPGVTNCGQIHASPGAFNIVPAAVRLAVEFRHGTEAQLDEMQQALLRLAHNIATDHALTLSVETAAANAAAPADKQILAAIEAAADRLGLSHERMMSFAGHDTQAMSQITPSGMIFVPSIGGVSHDAAEFTPHQALINGANTLLHTVLALMKG